MSTFMELIQLEARKDFSKVEIELGKQFLEEHKIQIVLKTGITDDDHLKIYATFCVRAYNNDYSELSKYFQLSCEIADEAARKYQDSFFTTDNFAEEEIERFLHSADMESIPFSMKKVILKAACIRRAIFKEIFHQKLEEYAYRLL